MTKNNPSVVLNRTFYHTIENYGFGNLPLEKCKEIMKDGRPFSHFIEHWMSQNYDINHVEGCKSYDFCDKVHKEILYDEKTFTKRGCNFCPSNMLGQGRSFDKQQFETKTNSLLFAIVSNIDFPNIRIRFIRGENLLEKYPTGKIPFIDHDNIFSDAFWCLTEDEDNSKKKK